MGWRQQKIFQMSMKQAKNQSYSMKKSKCQIDNENEKITTLDAVPPGQHASRMRPTERDGGSPSALLTIAPKAGIIVYLATQPNSI